MLKVSDVKLEPQADLSELTETERVPLRLLVRGHTIKSIASATQQSETAVNERLRRARKKTGVASSRELARILASQESWNQENGAGDAERRLQESPATSRRTWRWSGILGVFLMVLAILFAAALWQAPSSPSRGPTAEAASDPLVGSLMVMQPPNLAELHTKVRTEPRDESWASTTETALQELYGSKGATKGMRSNVRVVCAATLCEVAGQFGGSKGQIARGYKTLQDPTIHQGEEKLGLTNLGTSFGAAPAERDEHAFVTYLTRDKR